MYTNVAFGTDESVLFIEVYNTLSIHMFLEQKETGPLNVCTYTVA